MTNKEKNFASAVIYIHNAEKRIGAFLDMIIRTMEDNFEHSEIICVNDFSDDSSLSVIREKSKHASATSVSVINMSYFHGLELAMSAGTDLSIGDFIFEFDNTIPDFDPAMIMKIYKHSLKGFDIVSAAPDRAARLSSKFFYQIFEHYSDQNYKMTTDSFRVLSRRAMNRVASMNKTVLYRKAIYANCGLKIDTLKYIPVEKVRQNYDYQENEYRTHLAGDALILFTKMGYSFSKAMTALMMAVSLFMVGYSVVIYLTSNPIEGWTTTILFLSVAFFGLFGVLTVIIKYLQLIIDLVFKRKHYSFESIEKLTK